MIFVRSAQTEADREAPCDSENLVHKAWFFSRAGVRHRISFSCRNFEGSFEKAYWGFESLPLRHAVLAAEKLRPKVRKLLQNCGNFEVFSLYRGPENWGQVAHY